MRVLFFDSNYVLINLLPNGFKQEGHQVRIVGNLNEEKIAKAIKMFKPDLIVTQGWGPDHDGDKPELICKYAKQNGIPHIYWSVEDPRYTHTFAYPIITRLQPDLVFTICKEMVQFYRDHGFGCEYLPFGYEPTIHYPGEKNEDFKCNIVLVANSYVWDFNNNDYDQRLKYLKDLVCPLIDEGIRIDFFGHRWEEMGSFLGKDIPKDWIRGPVSYHNTRDLYRSSNIVLGLQSFDEQLTHRTYEIMASQGFLLTNDTEEIRRLFVPGEELIISDSPEKTLELVNYYLDHPEERERISAKGYKNVSPNTYRQRAKEIVEFLKKDLLKKEKK
ncbi:Uncharacterized protein conserved in bacteria [Mycobacteroides abscessus subsp. abscessus]|nr:Uncharacterized protein conserved in bacteria [Mycobacteroides abscessus subsp. abscessus]